MALVLLFDIDGTLLKSGNTAHQKGYQHALREVFGILASMDLFERPGDTDRNILLTIAENNGYERKEAMRLMPLAIKKLVERFLLFADQADYELMPGVSELLPIAADRWTLGILTGNTERIAMEKLRRARIDHYFSFGAYGNQAYNRSDLVKVAEENYLEAMARANGKQPGKPRFVIIDDSIRGIACAKENNCLSVGVATGNFSLRQLEVARADVVISSFMEAQNMLEWLKFLGK